MLSAIQPAFQPLQHFPSRYLRQQLTTEGGVDLVIPQLLLPQPWQCSKWTHDHVSADEVRQLLGKLSNVWCLHIRKDGTAIAPEKGEPLHSIVSIISV